MPYRFSTIVTRRLQETGWYAARKMDIRLCVDAWQKNGYEVFDAGSEFASRFLHANMVHPAYSGAGRDSSNFDVLEAMRKFNRAWASERYEAWAKEKLLPIGRGYSGHLTLLMGESSAIYGGVDDYFCRIGDSVEDAFENIFVRRQFTDLSA